MTEVNLDRDAVIVADVREGFALVSVEVSLTERAQRAVSAGFVSACDGASWVWIVPGLPPTLRIAPPRDHTISPKALRVYVASIAGTVVDRVRDALARHEFTPRVVTKGAA